MLEWLASRRSVSTLHLIAPGPDDSELQAFLSIASRTPDHGAMVPWRFILLPAATRGILVERLVAAFREDVWSDSADLSARIDRLRRFLNGPPVMVVVVSKTNPGSHIPVWEQQLSAGALCMNLLHAAHALGYGANWLTGSAASSGPA
jgi:nitroreductase